MRTLGEMSLLRSPDFYRVAEALEIVTSELGIRPAFLGDSVFLVSFDDGELCNPDAEPIGVFGDGKGDRQYVWRDHFWGEADMQLIVNSSDSVSRRVNSFLVRATSVTRLLYRLDRGDGGWNSGGSQGQQAANPDARSGLDTTR
jgi:hypothetical protein